MWPTLVHPIQWQSRAVTDVRHWRDSTIQRLGKSISSDHVLNWRENIAFREIVVDHVLIWREHTVFREIITVQITVCAKLA